MFDLSDLSHAYVQVMVTLKSCLCIHFPETILAVYSLSHAHARLSPRFSKKLFLCIHFPESMYLKFWDQLQYSKAE